MTLPEEPITAGAKRERVHARFNRPGWSEHGPIGYRGRFWIGSRLIDGPALIELVSGRTDEELVGLLQELAGFYSLLMRFGDTVYLAVDRVRSFPLFYAVQGQDLYVSDDAHWIRKQLGSVPYDLLTSEEFLFTGYVTGRDSLCAPIKQVQAGELVTFQLVEQRWESRTKKYYFYRHNQDFEGDESFFFKMLDEVLAKVFSRFISDANGRTIVIPLSGGYDSRLIAVMLKQFGYKDVITFSYGLPDNQESQISKQVADRLGFCWHFVPYHHEDWRHWFQTEEYRTYSRMADGLCSVPHEQDWPAVWQLAKQAILPADAIFSPGHTADVLSGSRSERVPALYDVRTPVNTALRAILHLHYGLQDCPKGSRRILLLSIREFWT
jgi:asparagine synthase (glutamine-hydrolysing)